MGSVTTSHFPRWKDGDTTGVARPVGGNSNGVGKRKIWGTNELNTLFPPSAKKIKEPPHKSVCTDKRKWGVGGKRGGKKPEVYL